MPASFLLIVAGLSAIVMLLWNWLMPNIFGLITINYWQALGIFILARILFDGFGVGKKMNHKMHHRGKHNDFQNKWMNMSPEQRKEFIEKRRKFGFGHPFAQEEFFGKEFHKEHEKREPDNNDE